MKNRFSKLIEKDGFYIILFICVCVVSITAVLATKENLTKKDEDNLSELEDFIIVEDKSLEPSMEIARMEEEFIMEKEKKMEELAEDFEEDMLAEVEDENQDEEQEEDLDFVEEDEEKPLPPKAQEDMMMPVEGEIGAGFTKDSLVYSETLEEWTSHRGIDILAKEGSEVKAALSGKVLEVYEDDLWGIVIIIDHGNGLMTKYANLSTKEMIKEGIKVNKGDVINRVGKTASIEMMMEPHIHFEIIKDGINIDPVNHLPVVSYLN